MNDGLDDESNAFVGRRSAGPSAPRRPACDAVAFRRVEAIALDRTPRETLCEGRELNADLPTSHANPREEAEDEAYPESREPTSNHADHHGNGPEMYRARLLEMIDVATRGGDVDEASRLLARLMNPTSDDDDRASARE